MNNWEKLLKKWQKKLKIKFKKKIMRSSVFILSPNCWLNLVFEPYLNVDELIFMQRTCKMFGFHERLKLLIKQRITEVFQNVPQRYWNRKNEITEIFLQPSQPCFSLTFTDTSICSIYCSTRERMINQFEIDFFPHVFQMYMKSVDIKVESDKCISYQDLMRVMLIEGINDYVLPRIIPEIMKSLLCYDTQRHKFETKFVEKNREGDLKNYYTYFDLHLLDNNEFAFKQLRTICEHFNGVVPCFYYYLKNYVLKIYVEKSKK